MNVCMDMWMLNTLAIMYIIELCSIVTSALNLACPHEYMIDHP